jgi:hypothetical protein
MGSPPESVGEESTNSGLGKGTPTMRQAVLVVVAVILLAGCATSPAKPEFIQRLVALCAAVNARLEGVKPPEQPGRVADEFAGFARSARSMHAPDENREGLDRLLDGVDSTAAKFRVVASAKATGDQEAAERALKDATNSMQSTDRAAQSYGMPHLDQCDEQIHGLSWRVLRDAPTA